MKGALLLCIVGLGLAAGMMPDTRYDVDPDDQYVRYLLQLALDYDIPPEYVVSVERIVGVGVEGYNYIIDYLSSRAGSRFLFECQAQILRTVGSKNAIPRILSKTCSPTTMRSSN